ncbi:putative Rod shape-determining protein [Nitrospina gracilis 3/211]|uniref:Putative Rod shape-determining protein n=1 Tax=Nitrospina gracilis (strain 3/211) TaxID=1266370 RepID=M1ZEW5_NITG3|nr:MULTISPECIES: rod shape-determining protein MreD [Nitrospina]MCF8722013.1 rod shape-determining protein MreD [Nitrospina sp. Nb-3]CCQ92138.1 putative Rod shape-determining protein [Nitrospina gracilis 3/211]
MWWRIALTFLLLFTLQTTLLDTVSVGGVRPDLVLILAVYCAIIFEENAGVAMAVALGFFQDCLSGDLLGVNTLSKGLIGFVFANLKSKLVLEGFGPTSTFFALASLFDGMIFYLVSVFIFKAHLAFGVFFPSLIIFMIYNAVVGVAAFYLFNWARRRWVRRPGF